VRAAAEGRPELVRQAMMVDPNTAATLPLDAIWRLADDMVTAHGELLPAPVRARLG
jgi:alpha-galactosidase